MNTQSLLIEQCKERIGTKSLSQELADILGINIDGAYTEE